MTTYTTWYDAITITTQEEDTATSDQGRLTLPLADQEGV
jgi:hypothetical protein